MILILEILFYCFCTVVAIQVVYYGFIFAPFTWSKPQKSTPKNIPVSVLICAKNEAENLKAFLPSILNQDYHNYEVILIDDSSSDDTLMVMNDFKSKYNNIKIVEVKEVDAFWGNKKYALTLGIKAAQHNFLLFTDADCQAVSNQWISEMSSHFTKTKTIVLGYSGYKKKKRSILNALIRFETLLTAIQYFSYAKFGMPYMAVGRNLAYRKETFFDASGFMSHMNIRSGDDDLFVNEVATNENTAISYHENSFTETKPKTSYRDWFNQKRRHVSTAKHYKPKHKFCLGLFYISQLLFWSLAIALLILRYKWQLVLALIVLRLMTQYIALINGSKRFNEQDLISFFPILELFLISSQLAIFIINTISKPAHWK